jgi:hypothetical protein
MLRQEDIEFKASLEHSETLSQERKERKKKKKNSGSGESQFKASPSQ